MGWRRAGEREQARRREVEVRRAAIVADDGEEAMQMIRGYFQALRGISKWKELCLTLVYCLMVGYN